MQPRLLFLVVEVTISLSNQVKPNLVKQNFVIPGDNNSKIVIDSNARIEAHLKNLEQEYASMRERQQAMQLEEPAFVEGLFAEEVSIDEEAMLDADTSAYEEPVPQGPTSDEIIAAAKQEAAFILQDAQNQADELLNEANANAQMMFEEQRQAGYEAGAAEVESALAEKGEMLEQQYMQKKQMLESEYQQMHKQMEVEIVSSITEVFAEVFQSDFINRKDVMIYLVRRALMDMDSSRNFRIHVCAEDKIAVTEQIDSLSEGLSKEANLEIVTDSDLSEGNCLIETDLGLIDCGIDTQFCNLIENIKLLCV